MNEQAILSGAFERLQILMVHPLLACNLGCSYCYQDAERTRGPVVPRKSGTEWAERVVSLFRHSQQTELSIVVTGGEPLLMGEVWFREFLDATAAALVPLGKKVSYVLQTNASLPPGAGLERLFHDYGVRFSVHYDGLIDGDDLRSHDRKRVIEHLAEAGFPLTAVVVGTPPALAKLPETLDFFHRVGLTHYTLNRVGGEGRGQLEHNPSPHQRAIAEFLTGFHAWRNGFLPYEPGIMWKFVAFCRAEFSDRPRHLSVSSEHCAGGDGYLTIYPDGAVYPCGFFCDLTGPAFYLDEADRLDAAAVAKLHHACKEPSPALEQRCAACEALIFCEGYCAMAAQRDNHDLLCEAQIELLGIMRDNPAVTTAIANGFLDFKETGQASQPEPLVAG